MKKLLIILTLLFLTSCYNQELINDGKNKKESIEGKKEDINSPYIIKKLQTYSGEIEISEEKKEFGIYILEEESGKKHKYLEVHNFSDDYYKEFEKYKNLESFRLSIYSSNGEKGIEKTLFFIKDNFFKGTGEYGFTLEDYKFNFTKEEIKILSQINISYLGIMGGNFPYLPILQETKEDIKKYKKEINKLDNDMKYILKNSKTLNRITILDYKIFTKEDGKIEIEDIRMSKGVL